VFLRAVLVVAIVALLFLVSAPLFLGWAATRRQGLLAALRASWFGGFLLLAALLESLVFLGLAVVVGLWSLAPGWRDRVRTPSSSSGRRRRARIDPSALPGIWSRLLREALAAREQFVATIRRMPRGPLREHLEGLRGDVDLALSHAWDRARRGAELERAGAQIDAAARASSRTTARWGRGWRPVVEDQRVIAAQRSRNAAAQRLAASLAEERAQLQVLVARLGEAACSAAELSVAGTAPAVGPGSGDDVAAELVDRLTALRDALAEAARTEAA
jgi:hypothetical protein